MNQIHAVGLTPIGAALLNRTGCMVRSYRILVLDGQLRPLEGMRLAADVQEREQLLKDLRAFCPGETFTHETVRPCDQSLTAGS